MTLFQREISVFTCQCQIFYRDRIVRLDTNITIAGVQGNILQRFQIGRNSNRQYSAGSVGSVSAVT